MFYEEKSFWYF